MYSSSSELRHSSTCTCAWAKFKSPPGEKPPVPAEFKFVRGESTGSRTASWILCCSSVSGVFALTESSSISDSTFMLRDRENHVRIHKNICRTDTDYSALRALTAGVVLESYLLCDSLDSGRVWHKCFLTPVSAEPAWRERIRGYRWWRQPWGLHVWKGRCRILLSLQLWWAIGSSWKVWQLFMIWN